MVDGVSLADADQEFFLAIYRSAVDFYQPRIEKKTGIALGKIAVWDYASLYEHQLKYYSGPWLQRTVRRLFFGQKYRSKIEYAKRYHEESANKCCAVYFRNGIYVSFGGDTPHEEVIALAVVHELSHALWEKLANRPLVFRPRAKYLDDFWLFVEGFATYAEREWFLDLYPFAIRKSARRANYDPQGVHYRGFLRIQKLVQQHGPEILPEIPRRWKKFAQTAAE